jgi:hypothetical protein
VHNPSGCAQHNNDDNNFLRPLDLLGVLRSPREPKETACGTPDPLSRRRSRGGGEAVSQENLNRQNLRPLSDPTVGGSRGGVPLSAAIASVTWLDLRIKKEDRPLDGGLDRHACPLRLEVKSSEVV